MLIVLSPAKTLDFTSAIPELPVTQPRFIPQAAELIKILREKSPAELSSLMHISDKLSTLNAQRYAQWSPRFTPDNSRPAILAFNGDVYEGLDAAHLKGKDLQWAQDHIALLSGLYGVLRPLDLMQPYRLEMGTLLPNRQGKDLYAYWGNRIAQTLREQLQGHTHPVLVNLASDEYFGAVRMEALGLPVVQPVFQDGNAGVYKTISFYAKRARGLMARYAITRRIADPDRLKAFDLEGYGYSAEASTTTRWVYRRAKPQTAQL
ncbi:peroxide stress protein YaaA [Thiomonas sp. FB-Cd]|uniref:peroxide stress protein YaaA n=1 Tax=Thiomonas sp. FB-Cd TaxID=1158292 RepID=UPI0004DF0964|nr:peroxide stress protein YaaA [Thiomonas sp. FB-Cd]